MLLAAMLFAAMQIIVKLSAANIGIYEQVFSRNLISMGIAFFFIRKQHLPPLGTCKDQGLLFTRSLFGYMGVVMFFYAAKYALQADVAILNRTSPAFVTLFAAIFLKEKITRIQIPVILLCFGGAYISMRPAFDSNFLPLLLALLSAVTSGIAYTAVAYGKGRVSALTVIFHFSLFSTVVGGLQMIPSFVIPSARDALFLILIGITGGFGQIALTCAYQMAPAAEISIYQYTGIIFTALMGYWVLGETLTATSVIGGLMIAGAALWSFRYHRRKK